ncbi:MAG: ABC transporter ATP-binding protein [Dehalococcoidia bacterium]
MASITFDHVTKRFDDVVAINDLSLEIPDKEFLVLVGPSGCGKSTALRMLAGLEEVTEGSIYIGDRLVNSVAPKDRDIAMVFQSYALYPHMKVYDNLAFGLSLRKLPKEEIRRRVHQAAEILGIEGLLKRKPGQLSGGQRQRVALGRAIVRDPAAFLMDEPLSNLDAKLRVHTRAELVRLHERLQATVVYVTHDQVEAMTMGSHIAVLNFGVLQQLDTPQNLYGHPANLFVAGFIGSPAMNFFDGRLLAADGAPCCLIQEVSMKLTKGLLDSGKQEALAKHMGEEVVFGIRPEHVVDRRLVPDAPLDTVVKTRIDVVEPLGNEIFLYLVPQLRLGEGTFIARMGPETWARPGQEFDVVFDVSKAHVFEKGSGEAII